MLDERHDNQDAEYLLSRELDGDLTPDERDRLDVLLRDDAALAARRGQYARLEASLPRDEPAVDWNAFHDRVMAEVAWTPIVNTRLRRRVIGIGLGLAAAAALVLAVVLPTFNTVRTSGTHRVAVAEVTIERPLEWVEAPALDGEIASAHAGAGEARVVQVALARMDVQEIDVTETPKRRLLVAGGTGRLDMDRAAGARGPF